VKEEVGKVIDDKTLENEGKTERMAGKIQEGFGKVKQSIKKAIGD
jgi:uncharacterized protein YjbJ (UPF0337 family)